MRQTLPIKSLFRFVLQRFLTLLIRDTIFCLTLQKAKKRQIDEVKFIESFFTLAMSSEQ
jgi:hypothetical protein